MWPLGFAPFDWNLLPILLLAALFRLAWASDARGAAGAGYAFGLGAFGVGDYWIANALHDYGNMNWLLAAASVALLAAYLALYPALALGLARRFVPRFAPAALMALPALWIGAEWLRAHLLTGYPWLELGYSQMTSPLRGLAPWLGHYGVGLAAALGAGMLAWASRKTPGRTWLLAAGGVALLYLGGWLAGQARFTHPIDRPIAVRLLQGNIPMGSKWTPDYLDRILGRYADLIAASPSGTGLVVLPETAIPIFQTEVKVYLNLLRQWSARRGVALIVGIPEVEGHRYYNAALEIDGANPEHWYRKQHLVPFGEYIPLPWLLAPLVHNFMPGLGSFTPGGPHAVLPVDGQRAGMSICYEDAFGRDVRRSILQGADFLVNISDYGWYGHSIASAQSLQMSAMRSLENQKPALRATNTGITAIIGPDGGIHARLPQFQVAALDGVIQPMRGMTPYGRFGSWPALLLAALLAAGAFRLGRQPAGLHGRELS